MRKIRRGLLIGCAIVCGTMLMSVYPDRHLIFRIILIYVVLAFIYITEPE